METITKSYEEICNKMETILRELDCSFEKNDLDDDINYFVSIETSGGLKKLGQINSLLYISANHYTANLIIANIYRFEKKEDMSPFYIKINQANERITGGSFTINEPTRQIIYTSSIYCGDNFRELTVNKIRLLLYSSLSNLAVLLKILAEK